MIPKIIALKSYVMNDPIRPEKWGESDISISQVFSHYIEQLMNNLSFEMFIA